MEGTERYIGPGGGGGEGEGGREEKLTDIWRERIAMELSGGKRRNGWVGKEYGKRDKRRDKF